MSKDRSRRDFMVAAGAGAAAIATVEMGGIRSVLAEEQITLALGGGSWGDTQIQAYIVSTNFEEEHAVTFAYEQGQDNVIAAKAMTKCGNPDFTALEGLNSQAVLLADADCVQGYDLDIVTNYADLHEEATELPRAGLENWFGGQVMLIIAFVWNTKLASKPTSYQDLLSSKYKGKVGIPTFGWYGQQWIHAVNKSLGGDESNVDAGMDFLAELKKNDPVIIENSDHGVKAFTREEIIVMPFWNGRCFSLQATGVPVDIEYVPGTVQNTNGYVLLKGTKFPEVANRFVNNTFDPELQLHMTKTFRYPPTNSKAKLPTELENLGVPPAGLNNFVRLDHATINADRDKFLERWNKIVFG